MSELDDLLPLHESEAGAHVRSDAKTYYDDAADVAAGAGASECCHTLGLSSWSFAPKCLDKPPISAPMDVCRHYLAQLESRSTKSSSKNTTPSKQGIKRKRKEVKRVALGDISNT